MKYINKKTGKSYESDMTVINSTNAQDGQIMILYHDNRGNYYVREEHEFFEKFTAS